MGIIGKNEFRAVTYGNSVHESFAPALKIIYFSINVFKRGCTFTEDNAATLGIFRYFVLRRRSMATACDFRVDSLF